MPSQGVYPYARNEIFGKRAAEIAAAERPDYWRGLAEDEALADCYAPRAPSAEAGDHEFWALVRALLDLGVRELAEAKRLAHLYLGR
jgi:hypothetical protein